MEQFDIDQAPLEIERKFLIQYPDINELSKMPDYRLVHMEQRYLQEEGDFPGGRVRRITDGDSVKYVYTYKVRISDMTRHEFEKEITEDEYRELLRYQTPDSITIKKDRHSFLYQGLTYELDVYEFWDDKATLEAEVDSEDTPIPIPPCVTLIKEVTRDRRYNNSQLSRNKGII
ncbi:CYTH domain-containing protein [uncultured Ruminococcus sp.]|uniref:CYTH domain-containing protein n=1 Tax=uncultured Ruminococcus sp. TaxID=165186 RepID=UPI002931E1D0|nr:CYTH domain-containing protein [uncultured Ruminococcus sp.]